VRESIRLSLDPRADRFHGEVDLTVALHGGRRALHLNASELTFSKVSVRSQDRVADVRVSAEEDGVATLDWEPRLRGEVTFHFEYAGKVSDIDTQGVFRQDVEGDPYLFSEFEPQDARRAFPCFDDPQFKIPWQLTIDMPPGFVALSNAPEADRTESDGVVTVRFAETHPLPTYLLVFAVGPFELVDLGPVGRGHTPMRLAVPRGQTDRATFAAMATGPLLTDLEDYFDLAYPYEKLDIVAVPKTVEWGAMENPGCIKVVADLFLWRKEDDEFQKQVGYAETIAHEMAHLWFGDFVTLPWWDDLWLNESFAEWLGQDVVGEWQPTWGREASRVRARSDAMDLDSLTTARRIREPIHTADDIENAFDGITYGKGRAVLVATEAWLGPDTFRSAMRAYVAAHPHGAGGYDDVIDSLSTASGQDVGRVLTTLLDQPGVPLVSVALDCDRGAPVLHLSQKRYVPGGTDGRGNPLWKIPFCVRPDDREPVCTVLTKRSSDLPLPGACPSMVEADPGAVGYYRIDYAKPLLETLLANRTQLSSVERLALIDNTSQLTRGGILDAAIVLHELPDLARDDSADLAGIAIDVASWLEPHLVSPDQRDAYERFVRQTFGPVVQKWGLTSTPDEDAAVRYARPHAVHLVAAAGNDDALGDELSRLAEGWMATRSGVDPALVDVALQVAAQRGDRARFDRMRATLSTETDQQRREPLITALGNFRDPDLVRAALDLTLTDELDVRDTFGLLFSAFFDVHTRETSWTWLESNVDRLAERLPTLAQAYLVQSGGAWCDPEHKARVDALFRDRAHHWVGGAHLLDETEEQIDLCIATTANQKASVREFLSTY
jgi:alanyl aminopeptidase